MTSEDRDVLGALTPWERAPGPAWGGPGEWTDALEATWSVYDGRVSAACVDGCQVGGCGGPAPWACGGCCECRGGCEWGYAEQAERGEPT